MKIVSIIVMLLLSYMGTAEFNWNTPTTHDFGKITQGSPVTHIFQYTNGGTEPLIITEAKASCGCTVPSYTQTPVASGESGEVKVVFSASKSGSFQKSVTLTANTTNASLKLIIKGEVVPAVPEKNGR